MTIEERNEKCAQFGYVVKNNICLFQKGILSQWWGGFKNQNGGFDAPLMGLDFSAEFDCNSYIYLTKKFNCCEQWMMANKAALFNDLETLEKVMDEKSPQKQKDLGREVKNFDPVKWNKNKYEVVRTGNLYKFAQNPDLKEFLMSFPPQTIFAEASSFDSVWGIGLGPENPDSLDIAKWQGENLLGRVISDVRWGLELKTKR